MNKQETKKTMISFLNKVRERLMNTTAEELYFPTMRNCLVNGVETPCYYCEVCDTPIPKNQRSSNLRCPACGRLHFERGGVHVTEEENDAVVNAIYYDTSEPHGSGLYKNLAKPFLLYIEEKNGVLFSALASVFYKHKRVQRAMQREIMFFFAGYIHDNKTSFYRMYKEEMEYLDVNRAPGFHRQEGYFHGANEEFGEWFLSHAARMTSTGRDGASFMCFFKNEHQKSGGKAVTANSSAYPFSRKWAPRALNAETDPIQTISAFSQQLKEPKKAPEESVKKMRASQMEDARANFPAVSQRLLKQIKEITFSSICADYWDGEKVEVRFVCACCNAERKASIFLKDNEDVRKKKEELRGFLAKCPSCGFGDKTQTINGAQLSELAPEYNFLSDTAEPENTRLYGPILHSGYGKSDSRIYRTINYKGGRTESVVITVENTPLPDDSVLLRYFEISSNAVETHTIDESARIFINRTGKAFCYEADGFQLDERNRRPTKWKKVTISQFRYSIREKGVQRYNPYSAENVLFVQKKDSVAKILSRAGLDKIGLITAWGLDGTENDVYPAGNVQYLQLINAYPNAACLPARGCMTVAKSISDRGASFCEGRDMFNPRGKTVEEFLMLPEEGVKEVVRRKMDIFSITNYRHLIEACSHKECAFNDEVYSILKIPSSLEHFITVLSLSKLTVDECLGYIKEQTKVQFCGVCDIISLWSLYLKLRGLSSAYSLPVMPRSDMDRLTSFMKMSDAATRRDEISWVENKTLLPEDWRDSKYVPKQSLCSILAKNGNFEKIANFLYELMPNMLTKPINKEVSVYVRNEEHERPEVFAIIKTAGKVERFFID